ncbi:MAG: RdgB/HAM1 family non-canonical purine NTP pyrophosphatase [Planctomycetota bacterium]|jgi:XTP/dITP diphosphohydrolase
MHEILLATKNPGKAKEMSEILSGSDAALLKTVRWRFLNEFPDWPQPVEDGDSFTANAQIKAFYYSKLSGIWTIADDSGLQVDALNAEPGVRSARYAGDDADDSTNNALLIKRLTGVPPEKRSARFQCACVLVDGEKILASAAGTVEGRIIDQARGQNGFGYDPHFFIDQAGMTAAQMTPQQKHALSHRGQALRRLRQQLIELLSE